MTATAWTNDRIDRLKTLWREGRTAEQIASELQNGISRSAVLGKVYRLGLSYAARAPRKTGGLKASPGPKASHRSTALPPAMPQRKFLQPPDERGRATLMTVRSRECRWPLGDPLEADFTVCGGPVSRGAYCARHAGMAYRPAPDTGSNLEYLAGLR